jgi:CheY-like chemotaxis protein/two-component sensor histidine kinase
VISNLDLLRKRHSTDPRALRLVSGAMEGAKRGAALTQRLLAFARRQDLRTESVDIARLLHGVADLLNRSVGPLVEMRMVVKAGLPAARVDANQLELALLNLVLNAGDAMPDGGQLTISLDQAEITEPTWDSLSPGAYLRLAVTDTGIGMDDRTLAQAIEPFFSTKGSAKGTGLGLAMVHGLALQLGGALRLSSTVGQGTTAELWLPVSSTPARIAVEEPVTAQVTPPATILVVDDDALIAMSTADMLRDLGHTVLEAESGAGALKILKEGSAIDILVTDQAMPGMRGSELAVEARALRPNLRVLLATGYSDLRDGAADLPCIGKPYQQDELANAIARLMAPAICS